MKLGMFRSLGGLIRALYWGFTEFGDISPVMEDEMEKNINNDTETGPIRTYSVGLIPAFARIYAAASSAVGTFSYLSQPSRLSSE